MTAAERIYQIDNMKAVLIFCVVFGHLLEPFLPLGKYVYMVVYSFHIPLFAFCSGFLAYFSARRVLEKLLWPFLLCQVVYLLFAYFLLGENVALQFTTPYWLLWYLWALTVWTVLLLLVDSKNDRTRLLWLAFSLLLGLAAGFARDVGYTLSLSRIIVFFPFFLFGYYYRNAGWQRLRTLLDSRLCKVALLAAVAVILVFLYRRYANMDVAWFFGVASYDRLDYSLLHRTWIYAFAFVWLFFALSFMPRGRTPISFAGAHAMSVYIGHGLLVMVLLRGAWYASLPAGPLLAAVFALLIVLLLASPPLSRVVETALTCPFSRRRERDAKKVL